jgi:hypothetical protein
VTLNVAVRKQAPTVPLPAPKYWQSRHQHTRVVIGGSALSQRTAPQRHLPVTVIALSEVRNGGLLRRGSYACPFAQIQQYRLTLRCTRSATAGFARLRTRVSSSARSRCLSHRSRK